jgi:hypothetical protein
MTPLLLKMTPCFKVNGATGPPLKFSGMNAAKHIRLLQIYNKFRKVCLFTILRPTQEFFTLIWGDVTIAGEGMPNLGLCSPLGAFEQGGIFIVLHLM